MCPLLTVPVTSDLSTDRQVTVTDRAVSDAALAALGGASGELLEHDQPLRGGYRAVVERVRTLDGSSAVVKEFHQPCEEWAREVTALQIIPPSVPAPRLLTAVNDPPCILMTDLGSGRCVADALLGDDSNAAREAIDSWAGSLARLHSSTAGLADQFATALAQRDRALQPAKMSAMVDAGAKDLDRLADRIGAPVPAGALDRLRNMLPPGGDSSALSPADACPDNNITSPAGLALRDFEGAEYRHVAWDVAYLVVPWPSCWCSWRLPDHVSAAALARYRDAVDLPYAGTERFDDDVLRAAIGWALLSTSWFAANALGVDPPPNDPRIVAPPRRAMILHRLAGAAAGRVIEPVLAEFAGNLRTAFVRRWGDVPLDYAPAFRPPPAR
jgi:hypothetical protein